MYYSIVGILTIIKKYLNGWEPSDIFYVMEFDESFVITKYYVKLGQWFENAPDIISLLKLFWYIPAWVVYIVANIVWFVFELFLPKKLKEMI